jgi:SAM-dependent methyltransferase
VAWRDIEIDMLAEFVRLNRKAATWLETRFPGFFAEPSYKLALEQRIYADLAGSNVNVVLEVGGIDRPLLQRSAAFEYVGLDIEARPDCYKVYDKFIVQSIEEKVDASADMVVSITLLEHVPNNDAAVRSIYDILTPGGATHHYVPSKWHPYSIALRMVGPVMQKKLIALLRPAAAAVTGYPAFFDHCTPWGMSRLFSKAGFTNIDVRAFYRASDYFAFFLPAYLLVACFENLCAATGFRFFCSGFIISARKP